MKKLLAAALVLALTGCATLAGCATPAPAPTESTDALSGSVTVFAAASLAGAFHEIADAFTAQHPGVEIVFSFGGSSGLATQIIEGAPADVFAAASPATMATVTAAGVASDPSVFATNVLQIAVPAGNAAGVTGLADFANPELLIAVCAVEVPCGAATEKLFAATGIAPEIDSYEEDVKAVLSKVEFGEVDAGLVYVTDVLAAGDGVEGIEVDSPPVDYPLVALTDSAATAAFIAFVLSATGQSILEAAGFGAP